MIYLSLLVVTAVGAALIAWLRLAKLARKMAAAKRRLSQVESERSYLINQTMQLAEENLLLKARLKPSAGRETAESGAEASSTRLDPELVKSGAFERRLLGDNDLMVPIERMTSRAR